MTILVTNMILPIGLKHNHDVMLSNLLSLLPLFHVVGNATILRQDA